MGRKLADLAPGIDDVPGRVDGEHCVLRYWLPPVPAICVVTAKRCDAVVLECFTKEGASANKFYAK